MANLYMYAKKFFDKLEMDTNQTREEADNDKQCFEIALKKFLESGRKEDAFTVYFCFSEIFKLFGKGYENTKKLLETLSDHEYHSGELLSKHRDHYSHSVYVFSLGLAIFASDSAFRRNFLDFYNLADCGKSFFIFLKYWGTVALFHDIGYPFQLAHEQIKTYSEEVWGKKNPIRPYVSYGNLDNFISIGETTQKRLETTFKDAPSLNNLNELFAYGLNQRLKYDFEKVSYTLLTRVMIQPDFMDHGYFSAVILARQLLSMPEFEINLPILDIFTAILLHNNFNKYDAPDKRPIDVKEHPLAYLLILCDELQCWDRLAYGKVSKRAPVAWDISIKIEENYIYIKYLYDNIVVRTENEYGKPEVKINANCAEMNEGKFVEKIIGSEACYGKEYVESNTGIKKLYKGYISSSLKLDINTGEAHKEKRTKLYASDDNFINLCDLAKAIHISYNDLCKSYTGSRIDEDFGKLPLEFKVSNIEQAKSYAEKLELINCFYSSKDLDYKVVQDFKEVETGLNNLDFLCREEHVRWVKEKLSMGWKYGKDYKDVNERNAKKIHKSIIPYDLLSQEDRSKDELMVNNIITLLKKFESDIKIYNYSSGRKKDLLIAGVGHRFFTDNPESLKKEIKAYLSKYSKDYRVTVRTCFAYGADQLIAECAFELGLCVEAYLPLEYEDYIADVKEDAIKHGRKFGEEEELRMRHLLAQCFKCRKIPDPDHIYAAASEYIVQNCKKILVIWDGKETPLEDSYKKPINLGGTYHTIQMAREANLDMDEDFHIIYCHR